MKRLSLLAFLVLLSACGEGAPVSGQAQADAQTRAACRERAEEIYNQQNRAEIYSPPPSVNTPFSNNYMSGVPDRGLADLYTHDKLVADCIRNTGTGADRSAGQPQLPSSGAPQQAGARRSAGPR